MLARALASLALLSAAACAASNANEPSALERRASFDLDCQVDSLHWKRIDGDTWGVKGCGKRATYVEVCRGYGLGEKCHWVMNNGTDQK